MEHYGFRGSRTKVTVRLLSKNRVASQVPNEWRFSLATMIEVVRLNGGSSQKLEKDWTVRGVSLWLAKLRSAFHIAIKTHLLTEYVLPVLVALVPLVLHFILGPPSSPP